MVALTVVPTLASLIAARELQRISGDQELSAGAWLRKRLPSLYTHSLNHLLRTDGSSGGKRPDLDLAALTEVNKGLYRLMSPVVDRQGRKTVAPFLQQLADSTKAAPAFVYLGSGQKAKSQEIMRLWNTQPQSNPFPDGDPGRPIWEALKENLSQGEPPVVISLTGDPSHPNATDFLAQQTVASLWERPDAIDGSPRDQRPYFAWLATRLDSACSVLQPWLQKSDPDLFRAVATVKSELQPAWLGGSGIGATPQADRVDQALKTVVSLADGTPARFADGLINLDRDVVSGAQTHWIKLLLALTHRGHELPELADLPQA